MIYWYCHENTWASQSSVEATTPKDALKKYWDSKSLSPNDKHKYIVREMGNEGDDPYNGGRNYIHGPYILKEVTKEVTTVTLETNTEVVAA